ncbi:unnamed protein product [Hymenolepis diminuta]|uniref:RT_RNaseH_2 domain-containing protein n=1 Tax=Hymenolepis diminuta TaxID=6216 RepID=A0A0R3SQV5_HYMDI|nr:unnamed protein product [Hymenolepis diminuta]
MASVLRAGYAVMNLIGIAKIAAILKPDKDPEDYVKKVREFRYESSVGVLATWHARNRDVYENRMTELLDETRIIMLFQKFNKMAFEMSKSMLTLELLLIYYDPSLSKVLAADASNYGIRIVISQIFLDGSEKATSHISRTPTPTEKK